jgi:hypothetical protein
MPSYPDHSPALSATPFEPLPMTPEIMPSDAQIRANITYSQNERISHPERPQVCVDTSLLFSSQANYPDGNTISPGLLSPYSGSHDNAPRFQSPQPSRGHSHSRSAEDGRYFGLEFPNAGRERGLHRVRSAPTSRHHSPYKGPNVLHRAAGNARSISPEEAGPATGSGTYYPANGSSPTSPSPSSNGSMARNVVATERIRQASQARRHNPPM